MAERQGIEIDYCPQCRGVWLDRGELDKIIERSVSAAGASAGDAPTARITATVPTERRSTNLFSVSCPISTKTEPAPSFPLQVVQQHLENKS